MKVLKYFLLVLLLLAIIFFGKGLLTPTVEYECEIMVDKPVEEVWAVMSDETKMAEWITGYKRTELVSGSEGAVGAVSHVYVEEQGQETMMEETIIAVEPNELLAMRFTMDFMNMDYEMSLEAKEDQTLIKTKSNTQGNGLFAKSILSFMPGAMMKQENENLDKLKAVIESNAKNYFPEEPVMEEMEEEN